jgi:hypothetical protein
LLFAKNKICLFALFAITLTLFSAEPTTFENEIALKPFLRISEGIAFPNVDEVRQLNSPYWDVTAGLSYEYLTMGASVRSHFLSSKADTAYANGITLKTEGHTVMAMLHVEGKADVRPIRFATNVEVGMIWFHEFDHDVNHWSRSKLPVIGLGGDFRIPFYDKLGIDISGGYMAAFEGFQVDAKAYNSVFVTLGVVYDGGLAE